MKKRMRILAVIVAAIIVAVGLPVSGPNAAHAEEADIIAPGINYFTSEPGSWVQGISTSDGYVSVCAKATGKLYVDVRAYDENTFDTEIELGTGIGAAFEPGADASYGYVYPGTEEIGIGGLDVKAGNTYTVAVIPAPAVDESNPEHVDIRAYVIPYVTRTLPEGKWMVASGYKGSTCGPTSYFKIKPSRTGYIRVSLLEPEESFSSGYVTLMNSKKRAISEKLYYISDASSYNAVFGVEKGVTYYIRVNDCSGTEPRYNAGSYIPYVYGVKYTIHSAVYKNNTKKSRAVVLKRKAKAKTMVRVANGRTLSQWYKFKVTKRRTTKIMIDASNIRSGELEAHIYYGNKGKIDSMGLRPGKRSIYTGPYGTFKGKARKGTYYIRVTSNNKCTGFYKIRYLR